MLTSPDSVEADIKTIYLTGAPAAGKSTTIQRLRRVCDNVEIWEYSRRLGDYISGRQSYQVSHNQLRSASAAVVSPEDIVAVDRMLVDFVGSMRGQKHIVIDSHPVTKEDYGFRCTAFSYEQIRSIKPDEIWVLYAHPAVTLQRIRASDDGRKPVDEEAAQMHTFLQASVATNYGISVGCPVYFFDSSFDQDGLVERLVGRLNR
jgi:adenylate kinase